MRRYREDAGIYAAHRENGTHPYTLGEIDARITACAADLAATKGEGPVSPPVLRELVATFWHRLYRDVPIDADQRGSFELELRKTSTEADIAQENLTRAERRRRDLEAEAKRTRPPVTGTILSSPWAILLCLIPGAVIEVLGSVPSLKIAFDIGTPKAMLFATAISAILILAADQLGNALASVVNESRRRTAGIAIALVVVAVVAAGWAVVNLAASRTNNLARQQQLEALESSSGGEEGGFGGFEELQGSATAAEEEQNREDEEKKVTEEAARRQAAIEALPGPSFSFFIPLSVLIMSTATLVAFRIETAREWNERTRGLTDVREVAREQRAHETNARKASQDAAVPEDQIFQEAAAYVEREHGLLVGWIDRFRAEYQRFCAVEGRDPRSIVAPRLPDPEEALFRLLYPRGRPRPAPAPAPPPPPEEEEEPQDDRRPPRRGPGGGQGDQAAPGAEGPDGGGARNRREPPPRPRRSRRRSDDGRPAGWGSPGNS